jgi:hypothetical protein
MKVLALSFKFFVHLQFPGKVLLMIRIFFLLITAFRLLILHSFLLRVVVSLLVIFSFSFVVFFPMMFLSIFAPRLFIFTCRLFIFSLWFGVNYVFFAFWSVCFKVMAFLRMPSLIFFIVFTSILLIIPLTRIFMVFIGIISSKCVTTIALFASVLLWFIWFITFIISFDRLFV